MTQKERLIICSTCHHRGFDPRIGAVCKLTASVPDFIGNCERYKQDASLPEFAINSEKKRISKKIVKFEKEVIHCFL